MSIEVDLPKPDRVFPGGVESIGDTSRLRERDRSHGHSLIGREPRLQRNRINLIGGKFRRGHDHRT